MRKLSVFAPLSALVVALVSLSALFPTHIYAADCGSPVPPMPARVSATSGPGMGEVTVTWDQVPHANRYALAYGTHSNSYMYGSDNIGGTDSTRYTVKSLAPGQRYYFRLAAARDCSSSPFSSELTATAGGSGSSATGDMMVAQPVASTASPAVFAGPVGKQMLWAKSGPGVGQVTLYWKDADGADNYHLMYGTEHGKFQYGALSIGNTHSFTISKLVAGKVYHFALVPLMGDRPLYTTDQVMAAAYSMPVESPTNNISEPEQDDEDDDQAMSSEEEEEDDSSINVAEPVDTENEVWEVDDETAEAEAEDPSINVAEPVDSENEVWETDDNTRVGAPQDPGQYLVAPDEDAVSNPEAGDDYGSADPASANESTGDSFSDF